MCTGPPSHENQTQLASMPSLVSINTLAHVTPLPVQAISQLSYDRRDSRGLQLLFTEVTVQGVLAGEIVPKATRLIYTKGIGRDGINKVQILPRLRDKRAGGMAGGLMNYSVWLETE